MLDLTLPDGPMEVLCLGAHADDIEIGCGGTLLRLAQRPGTRIRNVVGSASDVRRREALDAAHAFLGDALDAVEFLDLPDGRFPAHWVELKEALEALARRVSPDLILAPRREDAHQDHRALAELVSTVWRNQLVLRYEIPKWDPEPLTFSHYVALDQQTGRRKWELLDKVYPSQHGRDWWDAEFLLGRMRTRGVEARAHYAEAYAVERAVLDVG